MKLESQRLHDLEHGGEPGIAIGRQRLIKTFPAQTRTPCNPGHTLGASDVSQYGKYQRRITVFKRRFQVGGHILVRLKMTCRIPWTGRCLRYDYLSPKADVPSRKLFRCLVSGSSSRRVPAESPLSVPAGRNTPGHRVCSGFAVPKHPAPTGFTSPGFPRESLLMRTSTRARARRSGNLENRRA